METMKKITYTLAAFFASAFALTSCTKEMTDSSKDIESQGIPFEICASVSQTRTTTDNSWNTTWVAKDAINLFHAEAGTTTYVSDGQFTVENTESGKFKGNLARELTADSYDWYAFYPYSTYNKTPAGDAQSNFGYTTIGGTSQTQTGNNSQAHLCGKPCPLYGVVKSVSKSSSPTISMQQLVSVIEVNVTNNSGEDLTVSSVSFTGTEDIVGTFYINFTGTPVYTIKDASSVSETASLTVSEGAAIANGSSAKFYLAIKPFTAASGSNLKLSVNGYEKTKELTSDVTFAAGKIKKFSFDFDKATEKIIYSTEFNYSIVTTNGQTLYTNSDEYIGQDDGKTTSWGILYGNWNGSNCGQMRVYSAGNFGSLYMKFDVSKATRISYKAKVNNTNLKLNTYYSTDSGENWIKVDADKVLTTTLSEYSFTISETGEYDKNRVKFEVTGTAPSKDNYQLTIDDVTIFGDGEVVEPKLTKLATPSKLSAVLSSSSPNSIKVVWNAVENAGSYVVTATPSTGSAVVKEVTTASHTFIGLEYNTEYTISVYAKPSDPSFYSDSDVATYDDTITTGAKPESGGEPTVLYTLDATGTLQGTNNSYAGNCDIKSDGITWNVTGNTKINPWRMGGKSLKNVDRAAYTKTAFSKALTSIDVTFGTASSITVNSCKIVYSTSADFSNSKEAVGKFAASSTVKFEADYPANCYYKLILNVSVSSSNSNRYVQLSKIEFIGKN